MKVKIIGKNITVTKAIENRVDDLFKKVEKYEFLRDSAVCTVTIRVVKKDQIVEITVVDKKTVRVEKRSESLYDAIDMAEETLIRKLRKTKEKFLDSKRICESHEYTETEELECPSIVKEKITPLSIITKEEAIGEIESLDHDFHLFVDADTKMPSVLYRRKDGDYGVIAMNYQID